MDVLTNSLVDSVVNGLDELECSILSDEDNYFASTPDPVVLFKAITVRRLGLRHCSPTRSHFGGRFRIDLRLNPDLNCRRFEYRQDIRGIATLQLPGSTTTLDASRCFNIPGGLQTTLREDGEVVGGTRPLTPPAAGHACNLISSGSIERYGYRTAPPVKRSGTCPGFSFLEDRYLPTQRGVCRYRANDTYGLSIDRTLLHRATIRLRIVWRGRVIDTRRSGRTIRTLHWGVRGNAVVT